MNYNRQMGKDESLDEFVRILERIKNLLGDAKISDDDDIDLAGAIERLRLSGNNDDADELAEIFERAEALKTQHQANS